MPVFLVCTVGGSPEAVAGAVKGCKPHRVAFVVSPHTRSDVEEKMLPLVIDEAPLSPGQYDYLEVADAQDLAGCVEKTRALDVEVEKWLARGAGYQVVVDITGGTKCMSAALALVARRWRCQFSYVGGTERTKDGKGVVVSGKEVILHTQNPWDSLGYQAVEEFVSLFDKGDYEAADAVLETALAPVRRPDLKAELDTLRLLAQAYLEWDLFNHARAASGLKGVMGKANNLRHLFPLQCDRLLQNIDKHVAFLEQFGAGSWGKHTLLDLLANARRCAWRGRYDDGVARLYRAIEATAQLRLRDGHGIQNTGKVAVNQVPEPLMSRWTSRAKEGTLLLSLQDDYELLGALGDELAKEFTELGLRGERGPLTARNQSILAHGFTPVSKKVFEQMWRSAQRLAQIDEKELPEFPRLGGERAG